MIEPGPEVEHGRDESEVTDDIIKGVNHEFVFVLVKHSPQ